MTLPEILKNCENLAINEKRTITDGYCELVFLTKDAAEWEKILSGCLGPPIKPPGSAPSKTDLLVTKPYGGIREEQTLFAKEFGDYGIMAMFWPWQDGRYTTLKMAVIENILRTEQPENKTILTRIKELFIK